MSYFLRTFVFVVCHSETLSPVYFCSSRYYFIGQNLGGAGKYQSVFREQ